MGRRGYSWFSAVFPAFFVGYFRYVVGAMKTPFFLIEESRIRQNCEVLAEVKARSGCKVLLALKAFSCWPLFPAIREYLDGTCASSPWEAQLGRETFGGEVHVYAAAYSDADVDQMVAWCDGIDFNSFTQWYRFRDRIATENSALKCGLRINPECSTQDPAHALYDPCAPRSRLGICRREFEGQSLAGISGLHFHTLCEQNADDLQTTLEAVEEQFGDFLPQLEWVNFGGGHHVTRSDYDVDLLCGVIRDFRATYNVDVILEPGEAVAWNAGVLVATVLDVIDNGGPIAVLDCSCTCHMPDVLEMPYRPGVAKVVSDDFFAALQSPAGAAEHKAHTYRLTGMSCLAGDVIGDYSFDAPLQVGDRLVFGDMAHYSMVKTTFFNGIQHPDIAIRQLDGSIKTVRHFGYEDFKARLG